MKEKITAPTKSDPSDSIISFLGASLLKDFKKQFALTIKTLSKYQSKLGQMELYFK